MKNIVVGIIGEICAGKSTIASKIKKMNPNCLTISFGEYLKDYCNKNKIPFENNRKILQDIGQSFIEEDTDKFLSNVIKYNAPSDNQVLIFEGIRHINIFLSLKKNYKNFKSIFIEESIDVRFERYNSREKDIDKKVAFEDFVKINNHKVEIEIKSLKQYCDLTLESSSIPNIHHQISNFLLK